MTDTVSAQPTLVLSSEQFAQIKGWAAQLGFADISVCDIDLSDYEKGYFDWLAQDYHGDMEYMSRHGIKRSRPEELEPGTLSILSVRLNYFDCSAEHAARQIQQTDKAYISRYALQKDYHKLMRKRLQQLADKIGQHFNGFQYRAFCDSAPVLERSIAHKAGLGFIGKNSLIIHPRAGSWFFLGELYTNLTISTDLSEKTHPQGCGPCNACIVECPTQAIIDNGIVDSRRCISYLTIEYKGAIPLELRALMGNRIYGCDDCQLVCPWNKFTADTNEDVFRAQQNRLDKATLLELWQWDENQFLQNFAGSPIRRIGYPQWCRNLAVALGNIKASNHEKSAIIQALISKKTIINDLVDEHIDWAISHLGKTPESENHALPHKQIFAIDPKNIRPFKAKKYYLPKMPDNIDK
ncbi:tRNA epoxyqueuosine(34) reductase QueG [Thiomicrorhabdus sediminis]|uniref:Epoxyqueuosine reductase n=1 Tax=Thiomicrorhabdus sediminis TaxID=2580412 RepID=A0A4P9K5V0_9GAMM|nr:tRNA epoxyqueuosine(34) reductase QueG [Thiomicrorhabdus sediminis]QCU89850.1 tRNA epoxyqueuosine(34) reductase QueG [Thiomicrorhabdus sediminis]